MVSEFTIETTHSGCEQAFFVESWYCLVLVWLILNFAISELTSSHSPMSRQPRDQRTLDYTTTEVMDTPRRVNARPQSSVGREAHLQSTAGHLVPQHQIRRSLGNLIAQPSPRSHSPAVSSTTRQQGGGDLVRNTPRRLPSSGLRHQHESSSRPTASSLVHRRSNSSGTTVSHLSDSQPRLSRVNIRNTARTFNLSSTDEAQLVEMSHVRFLSLISCLICPDFRPQKDTSLQTLHLGAMLLSIRRQVSETAEALKQVRSTLDQSLEEQGGTVNGPVKVCR